MLIQKLFSAFYFQWMLICFQSFLSSGERNSYNVDNVTERDFLRTEGDPGAVGYTIKEAVALIRSMVSLLILKNAITYETLSPKKKKLMKCNRSKSSCIWIRTCKLWVFSSSSFHLIKPLNSVSCLMIVKRKVKILNKEGYWIMSEFTWKMETQSNE